MNRLALSAIFAAGCGTQGQMLTRDMTAVIEVLNDGTDTTAMAYFSPVGGSVTGVKLPDGDSVVASVGSFKQVMTDIQFKTLIYYAATFPGSGGGDTFTIDLRSTEDDGAPASSVTLPAEFEIDALAATQSRAQTMNISWSNVSSDFVQWDISGTCIENASGSLADAGAFMLPAGSLRKLDGQLAPDACSATLIIWRIRSGSLDAAFGKGGGITARQLRVATFWTIP